MIYAVNAFALGWVATIWSKSGAPNIAIAAIFLALAFINCAMAYPFVSKLIGTP